ncbi:hypothetical protein Tco_0043264 [Tanacetum coccineum]
MKIDLAWGLNYEVDMESVDEKFNNEIKVNSVKKANKSVCVRERMRGVLGPWYNCGDCSRVMASWLIFTWQEKGYGTDKNLGLLAEGVLRRKKAGFETKEGGKARSWHRRDKDEMESDGKVTN